MMHNIEVLLFTGAGTALFFFLLIAHARAQQRAEYWEDQARRSQDDD